MGFLVMLGLKHAHTWTKWVYSHRIVEMWHYGVFEYEYPESIRTRECTECGLRETKKVK